MSTYYDFYIGYKDKKDDLYKPLIGYDKDKHLHSVISVSRSFTSGLQDLFYDLDNSKIGIGFGDKDFYTWRVLPLNELPNDDFIKTKYYQIDDVNAFMKASEEERYELVRSELFYENYDPIAYAGLLKSNPKEAEKYMLFSLVDKVHKEYDAFQLRTVANMYDPWDIEKEELEIYIVLRIG